MRRDAFQTEDCIEPLGQLFIVSDKLVLTKNLKTLAIPTEATWSASSLSLYFK